MMRTKKKAKRTKLGLELESAFKEMVAHLRGEIQLPSYVVHQDLFTPKRIKMIRRKVASSTKEFERLFADWEATHARMAAHVGYRWRSSSILWSIRTSLVRF
jgi:hypothetical protein